MFDDEEAREQPEGQRGDGEEIAGDDRLAVAGEEGRPAAGGIAAAWNASQIPGDAAFGDVEAELQEFPVDPGRPPVRILSSMSPGETGVWFQAGFSRPKSVTPNSCGPQPHIRSPYQVILGRAIRMRASGL